jgi:hypothetical protein
MKTVKQSVGAVPFDALGSDLYDSLACQIERENHLINHRLTWTLQLNGFLFTAVALLAGKTIEDPTLALLTHWMIPATGLCVSLAGCLGVLAAQWQIGYLIRHWQTHLRSDLRPRPFGDPRSTHLVGALPSLLPTIVLSFVWGFLTIDRLVR